MIVLPIVALTSLLFHHKIFDHVLHTILLLLSPLLRFKKLPPSVKSILTLEFLFITVATLVHSDRILTHDPICCTALVRSVEISTANTAPKAKNKGRDRIIAFEIFFMDWS